MIKDEEIGYPHELISEALNQSEIAISSKYYYRTNLFAAIIQQIFQGKKANIKFQNSKEPILMLLESFVRKSGIREASLNFKKALGDLISEYNANPIQASYKRIMMLLKEGIILHLISEQSYNYKIFSVEEIDNYINCLDFEDNEPQAVLSALRLSKNKHNRAIPYSMIFEFAKINDSEFQNAAIFLSFELSTRNKKFKRELLISHYLLVKKVVTEFKNLYGQKDLSDQFLENLFKTAVVLFYCGYSKSLRLPKEESITYSEEILKLPSIESEFKEIFDEVGSIKVTNIHLKIRIWVLLAIGLILLILHWFYEIYPPLETSVFGIQISIPQIPAFLFTAIILFVIALAYLYRLETRIIKKLRRGKLERR